MEESHELPPVLPDLVEEMTKQFLTDPRELPLHKNFLEDVTRFTILEDNVDPTLLMKPSYPSSVYQIHVERSLSEYVPLNERKIVEVPIQNPNVHSMEVTSSRLAGMAGPLKFFPKSDRLPFNSEDLDIELQEDLFQNEVNDASLFENMLTVPPGFPEGIEFEEQSVKPAKINLSELLNSDSSLQDFDLNVSSGGTPSQLGVSKMEGNEETKNEEIESDKEEQNLFSVISTEDAPSSFFSDKNKKHSEWTHIVDISKSADEEFYSSIPCLAKTWPFELDTFQKKAILKLENGESVFVAAHTSAGKTVVAEYAVALSEKYKTRTIYTSPIKALSNQKFRDFKKEFKDVGLITGDNQINSEASCLIMTTEVLLLLLYQGSNVIRDLQYVIFDEIHYINDEERGVVWEEVLILIPSHVVIIMLSATVPNTLEFADWVGRTKKKKINVISTFKRPVPLEHYLYTGSNAKTKDDRFLIVDSSRKFSLQGYNKAVEAMNKNKKSSTKGNFGSKTASLTPNQEKNIWITLINHLNHQDKLPVVAFTLSRNRCDQNAVMLTSLDLCTEVERHSIHQFINDHMNVLKGTDRALPQVIKMTELLKRGIGIHHAGILPILKELVEMLFQKGLVKLLFATETFSVGINMPTRTVIFDNIQKNDGKSFRNLLPSEYIQMAGRAGRRGLDSTGTVIILVKNRMYQADELQRMMLGNPSSLESKFKLKYSMILNLFKVRQLRVEDMMKRSFSEKELQMNQAAYRERTNKLKKEMKSTDDADMMEAYDLAERYFQVRDPYWTRLLCQPNVTKALAPGRIVLVHADGVFKYGVTLGINQAVEPRTYDVLVYKPAGVQTSNMEPELSRFMNFSRRRLPIWDPLTTGHTKEYGIVNLKDLDIIEITKKQIKNIDPVNVIEDINRRKIPRFKDKPPGETSSNVLKELSKFSHENQLMDSCTLFMNGIKDFRIQDISDMEDCHRLKIMSNTEIKEDGSSPNFVDRFTNIFEEKKVQNELHKLEHLLSDNSLKFLPDYLNRVEVLKRLQYINEEKIVKLKGRVASKMNRHELLITELIFRKVITDRSPEEIAALLSCIVFQNKKTPVPQLNQSLNEGISEIKEVAREIGTVQRDCGFDEPVLEYVETFCFGLTEVVYEWAKGLPFAEITKLTEVHEGTIVSTIQMLDEVLRNIKDAALFDIGDPILKEKMDVASKSIRRDIVFTASLYTM